MKTHIVLPLLTALAFAGCTSTPPTFGDQLETRDDKASAIGKQWNEDNAAVTRGEKMIVKGKNLIEDGKNDQVKGQGLMEDGKKDQVKGENLVQEGGKLVESSKQQMLNSEADYQKMRATPIPAPVPPQ